MGLELANHNNLLELFCNFLNS